MQVVKTIEALRSVRDSWSGSVGLVPTMGALHAGHRALVERARTENQHVVATIFVNPTQFAPTEDLDAYPRDLPGDLKKLESAGVDLVFTPTPDVMYPPGYQTYVQVEQVTQGLEGGHRPGHFRGVTTVVAKLFNLAQPTHAYFGQKDAQQVTVIRRMVADMNFPLTVVICPTVRDADGLAMSSRNVYLDAAQRQAATVLYRALQAAGRRYDAGERDPQALAAVAQDVLAREPLADTEYVSVVDARTLQDVTGPNENPLLMSMAVQVGWARLIDNCLLPLSLNTADQLNVLGEPIARNL